MNPIMNIRRSLTVVSISLGFLSLSSCEDEELKAKAAEQQIELAELKSAYEALKAEAKDDPGNQSRRLDRAQKQVVEVRAEIAEVNAEIDTLVREREKLEGEFATYKQRYPVPGQ